MSQEQTAEKKNRFQISREVQQEFVNSVAENMLALADSAGKWKKPWAKNAPVGMPFCPATGREYGGANMVRLMLTGVVNGYQDDRWMTFKQLQQLQADHPARDMVIRKGEKGTKLLRSEELAFIVGENGKWEYLSDNQIKAFAAKKEQGLEIPDVQRMTLFYPFTVFNASQIEGFPPKEQPAHAMTLVERNELVERFIACAGVSVEHSGDEAHYDPAADVVEMPAPTRFADMDEYCATKLHEVYHATGHATRENRREKQTDNLKNAAIEEMRAEMFSMLAGAKFNLPMPESNSAVCLSHWNQTFSGGDVKAVFQATAEAARILTVMHQFEMGEQPRASWFPRSANWPELINRQDQRDSVSDAAMSQSDHNMEPQKTTGPEARPAPLSLAESAAAFEKADDPVAKVRILLQQPEFLDMALKQDTELVRDLASLCDSLSTTILMELDSRQQPETPARMRM